MVLYRDESGLYQNPEQVEKDQRSDNVSQSPDEKSYVFLLYPPLVASTVNRKSYFIRVQMKALVVGLLVHQMMLQCIGNILLQRTEMSMSRLSHVFMSPMISSSKHSTFTFPTHLKTQHLDNFLSALDLSYIAALKFDSRPGLKFLLQKVANLRRPANLYGQAKTAWTIKIFSLFQLCLFEVSKNNADLKLVTGLLNGIINAKTKYKDLFKYLNLLQITFEELCNTYVDITLDKNGKYTKVDMISAKKFFLILSQSDMYAEIINDPENQKLATEITNKKITNANNEMVKSVIPILENDYQTDENSINFTETALKDLGSNILNEEEEEDHRPCCLSNLVVKYSTDSGALSAPKMDISRSISQLDFSNSQVIHLDHSRNTLSENLIESFNQSRIETSKMFSQEKETLRYKTIFRNSKSFTLDDEQLSDKSNGTFKTTSYPKLNIWKSDDCLLYKRRSLNFIRKKEIDTKSMKRQNFCFRSKSMVEIRRCKEMYVVRQNLRTMYSQLLKHKKNYFQNQITPNKHSLKSVELLFEEFEKSRLGYRTNPFLKDEKQMVMKNRYLNSIDYNVQTNCQKNRDSEMHRKVWAEMVEATLEFALTLTDERLAPLLPVLLDGVKILTQHAFESILRQRLSSLFQRITCIYGLSVATTNNETQDDRKLN